jgi:hypothetical protein
MRPLNATFIALMSIFATVLISAPALAGHAYEMTVVPPSATLGFFIYRIDTATGAVASISAGNYVKTVDPAALPQGDYHLRYVQSVDGKTFWLYRMDSQTGHTWSLASTGWVTTSEPK